MKHVVHEERSTVAARWQRWIPLAVGAIPVMLLVSVGHLGAAILATTIVAALYLVERRYGRALMVMSLAAFGTRIVVAVALHQWSLSEGRQGYVTGDDLGYARLAWSFVQFLRGDPDVTSVPPYWAGDAYLFGTWVYLESALFAVFGPHVLVPIVANAGFAALQIVLIFDLTRALFGSRAAWIASALAAYWPSLVLWSALNIKDSLAILLITVSLWATVRFTRKPQAIMLLPTLAALIALESLRRYVYVGLLIVIPLSLWIAPRIALRWRTAVSAASIVFLAAAPLGITLGPSLLASLEYQRQAMGANARTSYVEQAPRVVGVGDTFVVPGGSTGRAPVHVSPNDRIVVAESGAPSRTYEPGVVYVRPGDVIVVGPPETTPAPPEARTALSGGQLVGREVADAATLGDAVTWRTLGYLPRGLMFALFAPFPWSIERTLDALAVAETLVWDAVVIAALMSLWMNRRSWRVLAPLVLFGGGLVLLFALVEGNVGTLLRHRGMIMPSVFVVASSAIALAIPRRRHWARA